jgi:glutaredoxin-like protein NrdH
MITLFTKNGCPNCVLAKTLLDEEQVAYETKNIEEDFDAMQKLSNMGLRSLPQVFKDGSLVPNGYQGLLRLWREGSLK